MIVFTSHEDYSDNSRVLSDYLLSHGYADKYKIYWRVNNVLRCKELYPNDNVIFFNDEHGLNLLNIRYFYQAAWQFGTHKIYHYRKNHPCNQHFIKLWHGCSFKDKEYSQRRLDEKRIVDRLGCDNALVPGLLFVETKSKFWNTDRKNILPLGYPRYDYLIEKCDIARKIYGELKGDNEKVVIWMPTFRNDKNSVINDSDNIKNFPIVYTSQDWSELDSHCKSLKILLLVKLHPFQKKYNIEWNRLGNIKEIDNAYFESKHLNLYSFLSVTDALITDYSSIGVDYLLTHKPIAYTLDDYEKYENGRGFIIRNVLDYMVGYRLYGIEDMYAFLKDISTNVDKYYKQREDISEILVHKSKNYCKDIVDYFHL